MKRLGVMLIAMITLIGSLAACGADAPEVSSTAPPATETAETEQPAEPTGVPEVLTLPPAQEGWQDAYISFLDDNYDIFTALWPDGISGMGFIDLDLDGTPELVVFDQGASATLGAQLFDLVDGKVYCVSSTLDSAGGAFGAEHLSDVSVCTSFFEYFRLSRTEDGWCFWVYSANGTMESSWEEVVRFDCDGGVLTPVSICDRYLESDPESGLVVTEQYRVGGQDADAAAYNARANVYMEGQDAGYEAKGVFLWDDMETYEGRYEGFLAMARDAAAAYVPITETVTLASAAQ